MIKQCCHASRRAPSFSGLAWREGAGTTQPSECPSTRQSSSLSRCSAFFFLPNRTSVAMTTHYEANHKAHAHRHEKNRMLPFSLACFFPFPRVVWLPFSLHWLWRHPFLELSASAGELLHDSRADSNLHGHRPAISSRQHPFVGSDMNQHSDPVSVLSEHPASPVLLTSQWPTWSRTLFETGLFSSEGSILFFLSFSDGRTAV